MRIGVDDNESKAFMGWSCGERAKLRYPSSRPAYAQRTWYERDIDQIVYSTVFRKMQRKSQLLPAGDPRRRTRLIHTLEVSRIATEISRKLGIDPTLTEAIALGHDLANCAYGAVGNKELSERSAGTAGTPGG